MTTKNVGYYPFKKSRVRGFEEVVEQHKKASGETIIPIRGSNKAAGYDFFSKEKVEIQPGGSHLFWSDIKAYMQEGELVEMYIRSSISIKKNLILKNTVGIIDCVPAGTMIKIKDGEIEVEKLLNEDKIILSYNENTKEIEEDELKDIFTVEYDNLIRLETEEGDIVEIPETKEVFTEKGWIMCKNLSIDDKILKF